MPWTPARVCRRVCHRVRANPKSPRRARAASLPRNQLASGRGALLVPEEPFRHCHGPKAESPMESAPIPSLCKPRVSSEYTSGSFCLEKRTSASGALPTWSQTPPRVCHRVRANPKSPRRAPAARFALKKERVPREPCRHGRRPHRESAVESALLPSLRPSPRKPRASSECAGGLFASKKRNGA